jgi:hypothetical protein
MLKQFTLLFLLFVSTTLSTGCGGGVADVSGTVSYNGNPVKSGTVTVRASDGTVYSGTIENGNYVVVGIPSGEVKFTVVSPEYAAEKPIASSAAEGAGRNVQPKTGNTRKSADGWFPIATKFADPDKSGIATTLKTGPNTFAIAMTDK